MNFGFSFSLVTVTQKQALVSLQELTPEDIGLRGDSHEACTCLMPMENKSITREFFSFCLVLLSSGIMEECDTPFFVSVSCIARQTWQFEPAGPWINSWISAVRSPSTIWPSTATRQ
jgi:hypothetical protein